MNEGSRIDSASDLMKALGNPTRIAILSQLSGGEEKTVQEITAQPVLGQTFSQSGISQHIAVLRRNGLVNARREHPKVFYSLNNEVLQQARDVLDGLKVAA